MTFLAQQEYAYNGILEALIFFIGHWPYSSCIGAYVLCIYFVLSFKRQNMNMIIDHLAKDKQPQGENQTKCY